MVRTSVIATALVLVTSMTTAANALDGRGYVQQPTVKPAGLYGVGQLAQRSYKPNRANDRLRSAGPATRNGCYDNDPNTPCLNSMIADPARLSNRQQRQVQGGNALDKPTFGEKFKMSTGLDENKSVNSGRGTDIRPWTTTRGSNRSVGRNDGYVQQIPSNKGTKGLATKGKGSQAPGVDPRQLMRQEQN